MGNRRMDTIEENDSREKLEEELIKLYPDFKTTIQVAFNRYN